MTLPGMVIYNDPVGGAAKYQGLPPPGLILVTHEHADHFDLPTLAGLVGEGTRLLTNPSVHDKLPADLKARATAIGNGESTTRQRGDDRRHPGAQHHARPACSTTRSAATTAMC